MVKCPHCKGEKVIRRLVSREWEEEKYEQDTCPTCRGEGQISELQAAVYKARGGPAPIPLRGYA